MFQDELKTYVQDNPKLVSMKPAGDGIFVLKYKKRVFYDGLWNRFIAECRGSIVDADFNLVTYPFTKIYNYGIEKEAPVLKADTKVTAFRKVNGFMVAMTIHNGELLVSTTGSTDSPFVEMAKEMMVTHMPLTDWRLALGTADCEGMTFMFECVHPNDPHIVPEKAGMYLLGARENTWGSKIVRDPFFLMEFARDTLNCFWAEGITTNMARVEAMAKECKHEGYVFYTDDGVSAKIKSPYYLTSKWVARNPRTDKLVDLNKDIKHNLDEEYYGLVDAIRENIVQYTAMDEQARLAWVREFLEN
ncbi:RNA ligase A [uncultured Caudovirales phage]|uniref:RNA ligase A n=1 Tax=uncultured Caudovirales phage TaxID=2100421 RepID=A0A6J5TC50_9CAUD|nr:RNA ligase A [uncultured Caudovirales phage]